MYLHPTSVLAICSICLGPLWSDGSDFSDGCIYHHNTTITTNSPVLHVHVLDPRPVNRFSIMPVDDKSDKSHIFQVVLTGGPCGGKSSTLRTIHRVLEARDIIVLKTPEVATLLLGKHDNACNVTSGGFPANFQEEVLTLQLEIFA